MVAEYINAIAEIEKALEEGDVDQIRSIVAKLDPLTLVEVINNLDYEYRVKIIPYVDLLKISGFLNRLTEEALADIEKLKGIDELIEVIYWLPSDVAVDVLQNLSPRTVSKILKSISPSKAKELLELLKYSPESVGGVMTNRIPVFRKGTKVSDVIEEYVKKLRIGHYDSYNYVYVIDENGKLIGWIDSKRLLTLNRFKNIEEYVSKPFATINPEADREEAARLVVKYDLMEIPVVDHEGKLLGVVSIDDVLDIAIHELSEDLLKHGGMLEVIRTSYTASSVKKLVVRRTIPLIILYLMNTITGAIIATYVNVIERIAILAAFLPMLADNSGNVGSQASTLIIRSLALGELSLRHIKYILSKEILVSLMMSSILLPIAIAIAFSISFFSHGNFGLAIKVSLTVAIALLVSVIVSDLIGSLLPLFLLKIKQDPASASAPLITTIADACTAMIYFFTATVLLGLT